MNMSKREMYMLISTAIMSNSGNNLKGFPKDMPAIEKIAQISLNIMKKINKLIPTMHTFELNSLVLFLSGALSNSNMELDFSNPEQVDIFVNECLAHVKILIKKSEEI